MNSKIVNADSEEGQRAGEAVIEAVENQLAENNPPETKETLDRLMSEGQSKENAMRHIATALVIEIFGAIKNKEQYNEERYIKNLKALPEEPKESL